MEDHAPAHAQFRQNPGKRFDQVGIIYAQHHHFRVRRIGQRSQNVEHGSDAQFFPDGSDIFHGGMVLLGEHEADADGIQQFGALFRRKADIDPQSFQAVRCAGAGGGGPVAVFRYWNAGSGDDEGGGGGDIDTAGMVSAGTHDLHHFPAVGNRKGMFPHGPGGGRNLIDGFGPGALRGQGGQVGCILYLAGFPVHDFVHYGVGFIVGEIAFCDDFPNCFCDHVSSSFLSID